MIGPIAPRTPTPFLIPIHYTAPSAMALGLSLEDPYRGLWWDFDPSRPGFVAFEDLKLRVLPLGRMDRPGYGVTFVASIDAHDWPDGLYRCYVHDLGRDYLGPITAAVFPVIDDFTLAVIGGTDQLSAPAGPPAGPAPPPPPPSIFLGPVDTKTQGDWSGVYGADGCRIAATLPSLPPYATVALAGTPDDFEWTTQVIPDTEARALRLAALRIAPAWWSLTSFDLDVLISDGLPHRVAVYLLDWDGWGPRSQRVDVLDHAGAVLDSRTVSGFTGGVWLAWTLAGKVTIRFTNLMPPAAKTDAVCSGIFFG